MINIVVIKSYVGVEDVIYEALNAHPNRDEINCTLLESQAPYVVKNSATLDYKFPDDTDIVLARMYSAQFLQKKGIKSVEIPISGYDIIIAVNECLEKYSSKKIAIFSQANALYEARKLMEIYECEFVFVECNDPKEIPIQIENLINENVDSVVGGSVVLQCAADMNLSGCFVRQSKYDFMKAIDEAVRIVKITRQEQEKQERLKNILDCSFEGIISADSFGNITLINRYAQDFLKISDDNMLTVEKVFGRQNSDYIMQATKLEEELMRVNEKLITVNSVPTIVDNSGDGRIVTFQRAEVIQQIEGKIRDKISGKGFVARYSFDDIISNDIALKECKKRALRFSSVGSSVLIVGETGTGKEMFAQSIHKASSRRDMPFVAVNCAALPENLLESELFGYVDGAFTGAAKGGKMGLFEIAHNGTIFLDEISDISEKIQGRLLRVIQEREIIRLGHDRVTSIDVRIIAATNKNLNKKVAEDKFRSDLLYRLDVLRLELPRLKDRGKDSVLLARNFIEAKNFGFAYPLKKISKEGEFAILNHEWQGNIRELRNFCERLCVVCDSTIASDDDVYEALGVCNVAYEYTDTSLVTLSTVDLAEKEVIQRAIDQNDGSRQLAAKSLSWSKSKLWRKMKKYNMIEVQK